MMHISLLIVMIHIGGNRLVRRRLWWHSRLHVIQVVSI